PRHTLHEKYKDQERAYFECIIAEIGDKDELNLRVVESREENIKEKILQVPGGDDINLAEVPSQASSPISDTEIEKTIQTLKHLAGDIDFLSADGIKRVRQNTDNASGKIQDIRKIVKQLVRVVGVAEKDIGQEIIASCEQ
ncbi:hypothetical protein FBU30_009717, partial [Linnemannia zychae]